MTPRLKCVITFIFVIMVGASLTCIAALWLADRTPTPAELQQPLAASQRQCIEQIVNGHTLIYASQQARGNKLLLGYTGDKDLYVAVINDEPDNVCHIEFNEKVFDCYH